MWTIFQLMLVAITMLIALMSAPRVKLWLQRHRKTMPERRHLPRVGFFSQRRPLMLLVCLVALCGVWLAGCGASGDQAPTQLEVISGVTKAIYEVLPQQIEGKCACLPSYKTELPAISIEPGEDEAKNLVEQIYKRSAGELEITAVWHPKCPPDCNDDDPGDGEGDPLGVTGSQ